MLAERVEDVDMIDAGVGDADEKLGGVGDAGARNGGGVELGEGSEEGRGDVDCLHGHLRRRIGGGKGGEGSWRARGTG